jgi:ubiquinone/menaquinone biosynthesis C-methylase UbiE
VDERTTTVRLELESGLDPSAAFAVFVDELPRALASHGVDIELRAGGSAREGETEIARVTAWEPTGAATLRWRPMTWEAEGEIEIAITVEPSTDQPSTDGSLVRVEVHGWGPALGPSGEAAGWFAGEVVAPLLRALSPAALGDWLTDRRARRPSGEEARTTYRDPLFHRPNFVVLLELLALGPDDVLLEVGCGGGAFLHDALESGCRAVAIDHSPDMVRLARETNAEAVAEGRVEILGASADRLPFPDEMFTAATMTGVLGFLPDPVVALAEIRRVLAGGGRLALLGSDPSMRGTPAAPEPMASRLRFYEDEDLVLLAHDAALSDARVVRRSLADAAREVGVPDEYVELFESETPFLVARKPG